MRRRIGAAVAGLGVVALLALHPALILRGFPRYAPVLEHLPGRRLDTGDPIYFHVSSKRPALIDTEAIRRAGELVPDDAIFYVVAPASDERTDDVILGAQLFLLPALRSRHPDAADWVLSFESPAPTGSRQTFELGGDLRLTRRR